MEYLALNNGVRMPLVGFGTWTLRGETGKRCILDALETGYRLLDTAQMYENEGIVGAAVRESGLARHEIFLTTSCSSLRRATKMRSAISKSRCQHLGPIISTCCLFTSRMMRRLKCTVRSERRIAQERCAQSAFPTSTSGSTAHSAARAVSFRRSIRSKRTFTIRANRCGARSSRTAPSCRHGRRSQKGNAVFLRSRC